ncbi:acyl transferase/acyl hydrolase/lysophospholipase, partial [Blyttiomyces helicus]
MTETTEISLELLSEQLGTLAFDDPSPPVKTPPATPPAPSHGLLDSVASGARKLVERALDSTNHSAAATLKEFVTLPDAIRANMADVKANPELERDAVVSRNNAIPAEELAFQASRKAFCRESFAKFIGVPVDDVHVDDIPVIAIGGSGGGMKAMLGTAGYLQGMEEEGLFDSVMYLSGVSGSCWTISTLYTAAACSPTTLVSHFTKVLPYHPGDVRHIQSLLSPSPSTLVPLFFGGLVQKRITNLPRGVVDIYGALLALHFGGDGNIDPEKMKLSHHAKWMDGGRAPMPIYTAVRHERPWKDRVDADVTTADIEKFTGKKFDEAQAEYDAEGDKEEVVVDLKSKTAWSQWFELSPFEIGSDELKVWIPSWAFGRKFANFKSVDRVPEQSFALQVGLVASAMCAPWTASVQTFERTKATSTFGEKLRARASKLIAPDAPLSVKEFLSKHPIHAAYNWNPLYNPLPGVQKPGLENSRRIQLIDAGSDNNQPFYPFTRNGRGVDVVFCFDSSEDVERN